MFEEKWNSKFVGLFLLGGTQQLTPTNTCAKGSIQRSPFHARGDITLQERLENEQSRGFMYPLEQNQMHPVSAQSPSISTCSSKLRCSPQTNVALETIRPGSAAVLKEMIADAGVPADKIEDGSTRVRYFVVKGIRRANPNSNSVVVVEHADFFMTKIWPTLHQFLHTSMEATVRVQVAYKETKHL